MGCDESFSAYFACCIQLQHPAVCRRSFVYRVWGSGVHANFVAIYCHTLCVQDKQAITRRKRLSLELWGVLSLFRRGLTPASRRYNAKTNNDCMGREPARSHFATTTYTCVACCSTTYADRGQCVGRVFFCVRRGKRFGRGKRFDRGKRFGRGKHSDEGS